MLRLGRGQRVAEELRRQGPQVCFLGLIDSYLPDEGPGAPQDYREDLAAFLEVLCGHRPAALVDLAADRLPDEQGLAAAIQAVLAPEQADSARMDAQEMAHVFLVAMNLKALSLRLAPLPVLGCDTWCWWATSVADDARRTYEAGFTTLCGSERVPAGHFELLRDAGLLEQLLSLLGEPEVVAG